MIMGVELLAIMVMVVDLLAIMVMVVDLLAIMVMVVDVVATHHEVTARDVHALQGSNKKFCLLKSNAQIHFWDCTKL